MNKKLPVLFVVIVIIVGSIVALSGGLGGNGEVSPFNATDNSQSSTSPIDKPKLEVGKEAPDFEALDFEGNTVRLSDFRGKPVMVDFWADWCPFCTGEMPIIDEVFKEFGGELIVLGIHRTATESLETGKGFADELGISYPLLQDKTDEIYKIYGRGQQFMPLAVFIDGQGTVVSTKAGPKTADEIREKIGEIAQTANEQ